jgi:propanol-preferring alcohol dehydrogenase
VGTRLDLEEALSFAAEGKVKATIEMQPLLAINSVFERMKRGKVNGRIVLDIGLNMGIEERDGTARHAEKEAVLG